MEVSESEQYSPNEGNITKSFFFHYSTSKFSFFTFSFLSIYHLSLLGHKERESCN